MIPRSRWGLLALVLALACKPDAAEPTPAVSYTNLSYGTNSAQIMDVQLPAGRTTTTPVVVFIHGGGWSGGDKSIFLTVDLQRFIAAGYATVNINYRLASNAAGVHDPLLSTDVTAAIDFIAAHAAEYQVAPATFALVGHSAGAHLALLASYKYDPAHRIKAVASLSGPTDLNDSTFLAISGLRALIEEYLGVTQIAAPARWTAASPVSIATAAAAPTIILQGTLDVLVPHVEGEKLDARLTALGVTHEYRVFANYGHDLGYATFGSFPDDAMNPVLAWFRTYLK